MNSDHNYDKLSEETKGFIQSVLANSKKRDWYHIVSISVTALALLLFVLVYKLCQNPYLLINIVL